MIGLSLRKNSKSNVSTVANTGCAAATRQTLSSLHHRHHFAPHHPTLDLFPLRHTGLPDGTSSIDGLGHVRGRAVAPAIIRRAEIRAAFHQLARYLHIRCVRIVALFSFCAAGVDGTAAGTSFPFRPVEAFPSIPTLSCIAGSGVIHSCHENSYRSIARAARSGD